MQKCPKATLVRVSLNEAMKLLAQCYLCISTVINKVIKLDATPCPLDLSLWSRLYNLKLIIYVCRVLSFAQMARTLQFIRHGLIVLLDTAFAVPAKSIATEVGIVLIQILLCVFGLFSVGLERELVFAM